MLWKFLRTQIISWWNKNNNRIATVWMLWVFSSSALQTLKWMNHLKMPWRTIHIIFWPLHTFTHITLDTCKSVLLAVTDARIHLINNWVGSILHLNLVGKAQFPCPVVIWCVQSWMRVLARVVESKTKREMKRKYISARPCSLICMSTISLRESQPFLWSIPKNVLLI